MKVGVLTFHRCINYGSYWQARCLVEGLRAMGHDAELLDHDAPEVRSAEWRCAFSPRLPERTERADIRRYGIKARKFLSAFDRLEQSRRFPLDRPEETAEYDAVVVGSDEVWNFRHPWYGFKPIFFGERLRTGRLVSYAASFGNHDASSGLDADWARKLERFAFISVRDENSREIVRRALGRDPALVLDPCLQFPPAATAPAEEEAPYLAVYGHGFPEWFVRHVKAWARATGRRLLSIGYRNDWADEQRIEAGPDEFSSLIAGADAVATNFFHGCVFALHHRKPFACTPSAYRFNKVRDLVQSVGASAHMVDEATPAQSYEALLGLPLDQGVEFRIAALRAQSSRYLETALG
jgi:hypothetical protein